MSPRRQKNGGTRFPDAPLDGPLLEVDNVKTMFKTPRGLVHAVDGVEFTLERGKTIGIVGESGCGKSVLSRSIMGLLPNNVVREGSIRFEGNEIGHAVGEEMRHFWGTQMSMVFQDPMTSLNPVMRIGNQITESLRYHLDVSKDYANEAALALLQSVGIPEAKRRLREYPHQLSGGMRQRVMIAIALACGPKLLFADEPTTALDVTVQAQILDLLQQQQRERFMAMVLVTHDLGVVAGRTDDIAVMYAGRIVEKAPTRLLFSETRHPYTEALLKSIPKLAQPSHMRLDAIAGRPPDLVNPPPGCKFAPRCPYAQARCLVEEPPLDDSATPGHAFRCFYPVGSNEGKDALARNLAAGATASGRPVFAEGDALATGTVVV
ncbi:MAG: oligopeptide/dipeptide transporter, ATP-binding protein [Actinomycetia bacterium]|nr:oligopeptide/dipeptide transporter, ATP-binding protein [Actinomycetes bacterium]